MAAKPLATSETTRESSDPTKVTFDVTLVMAVAPSDARQ